VHFARNIRELLSVAKKVKNELFFATRQRAVAVYWILLNAIIIHLLLGEVKGGIEVMIERAFLYQKLQLSGWKAL